VDQAKFEEAQKAYDARDYRSAAKLYLASAGKGATGNGAAYHMAGNSLIRLRRHQDAVTVYGHALRDETYDRLGAVHANRGAAYAALGEYAEAVREYESALEQPDYTTPYKALQGMGAALMERGRIDEAAVAYRRAALDTANPDPGKALVNLGLCFMALGRPADAVEAYKAALGFDEYQGRGRALANLGQAYTAMGEYDEAVKSFEKATQLHGHTLSPAAQEAYDTAVAATRHARETVDGWETGDMPLVPLDAEPEGWDTGELRDLTGVEAPVSAVAPEPQPLPDDAATALGMGDDEAVSDFFSMTEEEMKAADREARRAERSERRGQGGWVRVVVIALVVAVVLVGAVAAAWWFGFGWPTQSATVNGALVAYQKGEPVDSYWVAVPDKDVAREMAKIPPLKEFAIDGVDRSAELSTATITVTPEKGAPLHYSVTLVREGVGWKITGVENDWRSTGG